MSPIPSVATAFALSAAATPSVALDPNSTGQTASPTSQHVLATSGLVFAVVAIFSVAGYFLHGRGRANPSGKSDTWASFRNFVSSIRPRGSTANPRADTGDWPPNLEVGPEQHVSMVYARFFHPTSWNVVESHPATASAPAIYVEEEAEQVPVPEPKPFGMNSFLDMDDDNDDGLKDACEKPGHGACPTSALVPPYDTTSATNVGFKSEIIGSTVRSSAFLSIPGDYEDDSTDTSSDSDVSPCDELSEASLSDDSEFEADFIGSPYGGILTAPPVSSDDLSVASLSDDSEFEFGCSPYDGIAMIPPRISPDLRRHINIPEEGCSLVRSFSPRAGLCDLSGFVDADSNTSRGPLDRPEPKPMVSNDVLAFDTRPGSSNDLSKASFDSESNFEGSPYAGIVETPPRSLRNTRRYGMPDMADVAQTLKETIPEDGYNLVRTFSPRTGLCDLSDFVERDSTTSREHLDRIEPADNRSINDSPDDKRRRSGDADVFAAPQECLDLMQELFDMLHDSTMDCTPRALSESSVSEDGEDDEDDERVLRLTLARGRGGMRRISPESTPSRPVSGKGPVYPLIRPLRFSRSCGDMNRMPTPVAPWFNEEASQFPSATFSDSRRFLRSKASSHTYSRSQLYAPRSIEVASPRSLLYPLPHSNYCHSFA